MEVDSVDLPMPQVHLAPPIDRIRVRYRMRLDDTDLPESVRGALVTLIDAVAPPTVDDVTKLLSQELGDE